LAWQGSTKNNACQVGVATERLSRTRVMNVPD
jgi:hypothetical protein